MLWPKFHSLLLLSLLLIKCSGNESLHEVSDYEEEAPMVKREREALYIAIQGFVGDSWNGSDLYPDPCGWTPIQGVSCDIFNNLWYVTDLSLGLVHENSLSCSTSLEIRAELFELKHLRSLSFFNCFISPIDITKGEWSNFATNLESLEFRSNPGLIGKFPENIGNLAELKSLVVLENGFNEKLPASICNLKSLKRMVFARNAFTGPIPNCFKGLKELLILDLSSNSFSGTLPSSIGDFVSLLKLDLSNNLLEGNIPREIGFLQNLTLLDLRKNRFSGGLSNIIEKIQSLTELVLSDNPMSKEDMMAIKWEKMGNLVILDVSKMGLSGEIPIGLTTLKRLRFLGLNDNNLTGSVPSEKLEALPCLGSLYINGNNLTGELRFSNEFYEKMGTRFKASRNPNLCQPFEMVMSESRKQPLPLGVKPCT
ncbi:unnamed protein product [Cochlearia groenlandica]